MALGNIHTWSCVLCASGGSSEFPSWMFKYTRKETVLLFALSVVSLTSIIGNTVLLIHGGSNSLHLYKHVVVSFRGEIPDGGYNAGPLLLEASTPSTAQSKSNSPSSNAEHNEHPDDTVSTVSSDTVSVANISSTTHPISEESGPVAVSVSTKLQPKCHTPHCSQFLSMYDRKRLYACFITAFDKVQSFKELRIQLDRVEENSCDFMNGTGRDPVALASPPGSGNTWVRGLLERATGFCTGYIQCDYSMRMRGFIGENINSGSVLVVKTHLDTPHWTGKEMRLEKYTYYGSAIVLLRNPYNSLVAEWNRQLAFKGSKVDSNGVLRSYNSHTNVVISKRNWYSNGWYNFVRNYLQHWLKLLTNWILKQSPEHPVLVVKYEDLKQDTVKETERIMRFLKLQFDSKVLAQTLEKDFTEFKRPHSNQTDFKRYDDSQLLQVKGTLTKAMELIKMRNMTHVLDLKEYLKVLRK